MVEWNLNLLPFVHDTALVADSEERLKQLVKECGGISKNTTTVFQWTVKGNQKE